VLVLLLLLPHPTTRPTTLFKTIIWRPWLGPMLKANVELIRARALTHEKFKKASSEPTQKGSTSGQDGFEPEETLPTNSKTT
jgi:hypothetical protein